MTDCVLGIDVGTSGVRVAAVDLKGQSLSFSTAALSPPSVINGHAMQDADEWWQAVSLALDRLERSQLNILAIAIDGTSGTILPIDQHGRPLGLASMYNDVADQDAVSRVNHIASETTAARGQTSPLARALPSLHASKSVIHQADWIAGQFLGHYQRTDENNALKTGYDPVLRRWPDWMDNLDFDLALLPEVVPAGQTLGSIVPTVADRFHLSRETQIIAGTTDGCAAFLASGAKDHGDGVTSLGTTLTIKLLSQMPIFAPHYGIYSHRIGDDWLAGGASNTGGAVLSHYFSVERMMELEAAIAPDHPTGYNYYPLLKPGERFPINDPTLPPRLDPRPAEDAIFLQALFEGIASIEALAYSRLAELGATPLTTFRSVGGAARNRAFTAIRARSLKVPIRDVLSDHAAVGVARLAWRGLGYAT